MGKTSLSESQLCCCKAVSPGPGHSASLGPGSPIYKWVGGLTDTTHKALPAPGPQESTPRTGAIKDKRQADRSVHHTLMGKKHLWEVAAKLTNRFSSLRPASAHWKLCERNNLASSIQRLHSGARMRPTCPGLTRTVPVLKRKASRWQQPKCPSTGESINKM